MSFTQSKRLHPQAYDALTNALAAFQWYKPDFARMLNTLFTADPSVLSGINVRDATKREVARLLVDRLQRGEDRYQAVTIGVLITLSEYDDRFAHLARLDDGEEKVTAAQAALADVKRIILQHKAVLDGADARKAAEAAATAAASQQWAHTRDLDRLKIEFYAIASMSDPRARGLALEPFLNKLFSLFDLEPRGAFKLTGEQIDGAFTFDTDDYLLEARWRKERVDPGQVRDFSGKVAEKTHRTSGLLLSMEGYTPGAVDVLRGRGTRLLLADGSDLMAVLEGAIRLEELLLRKRRHAAETGDPYLSARQIFA
jgi:hypothetical protein